MSASSLKSNVSLNALVWLSIKAFIISINPDSEIKSAFKS